MFCRQGQPSFATFASVYPGSTGMLAMAENIKRYRHCRRLEHLLIDAVIKVMLVNYRRGITLVGAIKDTRSVAGRVGSTSRVSPFATINVPATATECTKRLSGNGP
jgi:hypothetical protein